MSGRGAVGGLCLQQALAVLEDAGLSGEVIVVDNGSTDGSPGSPPPVARNPPGAPHLKDP